MKKFWSKLGSGLQATGLFLWENKRNIGILASTFILPAVNTYFPNAMTPGQYNIWYNGAQWLAVVGVAHNTVKHGRKVQKQNGKGDGLSNEL